MARNPALGDSIDRIILHDDQIRDLRNQGKGHTESKNYIIGGDIAAGLVIPGFYVGIDYDDHTPEWKKLAAFRGHVETGSVTLDWYVDGVLVATGHVLTTVPNEHEVVLDPFLDVSDATLVKPVVTGAGTGTDMCACSVFVTGAL